MRALSMWQGAVQLYQCANIGLLLSLQRLHPKLCVARGCLYRGEAG